MGKLLTQGFELLSGRDPGEVEQLGSLPDARIPGLMASQKRVFYKTEKGYSLLITDISATTRKLYSVPLSLTDLQTLANLSGYELIEKK